MWYFLCSMCCSDHRVGTEHKGVCGVGWTNASSCCWCYGCLSRNGLVLFRAFYLFTCCCYSFTVVFILISHIGVFSVVITVAYKLIVILLFFFCVAGLNVDSIAAYGRRISKIRIIPRKLYYYDYYAAVPVVHIMGLARLSIYLSVQLSVLYGLLTWK